MVKQPPAHYIRHNKVNRVPKCWLYVMVSHSREDRKNGYKTRWRAAAAVHECPNHNGHGKAVRSEIVTDNPEDLWRFIDEAASPQHRLIVATYDLQQLLQTAKGYRLFQHLGWNPTVLRVDTGGAGSEWRNGRRKVVMCDLRAWIPKPLGIIRKDVNGGFVVPMDARPARGTGEYWAVRTCEDVAAIWRDITQWLETEELGNWKATGASMSWQAYRHKFMSHRILCHDDDAVRQVERESTYGGRAEAYRVGGPWRGEWAEWDTSSAYARICREVSVPVRLIGESSRVPLSAVLRPRTGRARLVRAEVATDVPTLPWRDSEGLCWPIGTFTGTWWDFELAQAVTDGAQVRPERAWLYATAPALSEWAEWVMAALEGRTDGLTAARVAVVKHWSRALIGRFGAQWPSWEYWGDSFDPERIGIRTMLERGKAPRRMLELGPRTFIEGDRMDATDSAPAIMSYVMAECRMRLWRIMQLVGLEHVLHCDTDGFICDKYADNILREVAPDGWRRKGTWRNLRIFGSRRLDGDLERRLPGVPKTAERISDTQFAGEVTRRASAALAIGESDSVTTHYRIWNVIGREHRRIVGVDGGTRPVVVNDNNRCAFEPVG